MSTNKITHYSSEEQLFHKQSPQQHHPHYGFQQQLHFQHSSDDKQQLIDNIGVSRRLGDSVINELDNRATNLLANLTASAISNSYTDNDSGVEKSSHKNFSSRFESVHGELIQNMDSIDTHYAVKRNRQGLNVPATPTRYSIQDAMNSTSVAKDTDRAELLYNKRARDSMGNVVERLTNSPVTDITRRIRRLRMNMNTPREHHREQERQRRRSSIVRQSLTGSTDKENHLPKSKGYTNLYGEVRSSSSSNSSDVSSSSFLHDSAPTFAKPTITSIQKMLTPFIRHNHDSGPIFSTYRKRPSPAASSCSPNTSLQSNRQSSPIPTPRQQVAVSSRSQSAGPSTCISGATKFRPQLSLDTDRDLQLEDSANSHEKSRVVASKNVFERLYNQPTTSANKKTTIRKSTTQGDLSYISKHKNNSGESFESAYDSTYGATKTSSAHSSLPRSRTIGDIKTAKSKNESLPLHSTSTLPRSTTGGDLSLRGNAVTVTSRRPIWR